MSLTLIAIIGILFGFLCLIIGFFMDDGRSSRGMNMEEKPVARSMKKKGIVPRRKAA